MNGTPVTTNDAIPAAYGSWSRISLPCFVAKASPADWAFIILPCVTLLAALAACCIADIDVAASQLFYDAEYDRWPLAGQQPWRALYEYGCRPSIWIGVTGLVIGVVSYKYAVVEPLRLGGFFLAITLALGPGILVNAVLKPSVGRPRPCQTIGFGGEQQFAFFGGAIEANKSFPSGHASMGFYLMTPALLLYRRRPRLAVAILLAGLAYGGLIGFARVVQGGHFVTDVLASALIVYASGAAVLLLLRQIRDDRSTQSSDDESQFSEAILLLPTTARTTSQMNEHRAA